MDIWSVKEAVVDRCYEKFGFELQPEWTVVDIGAAIGEFAILAAAHPVSRVLAFEPLPESAALLRENSQLNRLKNIEVFEVAVAGTAGTVRLDTSGEPTRMGIHAPDDRSIAVQSVTLSEVVVLAGSRIDLLKMDCEGAEYEILMAAGRAVLDQVDRIVLEYHDHRIDLRHTDLVRYLQEHGFRVETFPNVVHPARLGYIRAGRNHSSTPLLEP